MLVSTVNQNTVNASNFSDRTVNSSQSVNSNNKFIDGLASVRNSIDQIFKELKLGNPLEYNGSNNIGNYVSAIDGLGNNIKTEIHNNNAKINDSKKSQTALSDLVDRFRKHLDSLDKISNTKVRLKEDKSSGSFVMKECYSGFSHFSKSLFSSSYKNSLEATMKEFKTLDKNQIASDLNSKMTKAENAIEKKSSEINQYSNRVALLNKFSTDLLKGKEFIESHKENLNKAMADKRLKESQFLQQNKPLYSFDTYKQFTFKNIYSTNKGCALINQSLRENKPLNINTSSIINELTRRHEGIKSDPREKDNISTMTSNLTLDKLKEALKSMYNESVQKHKPITLFRGQGITIEGIRSLENLRKSGKLISPTAIFSTSKSVHEAQQFMKGSDQKLFIKIEGKTAMGMASSYGVDKEDEYAFTPFSRFEIKSLTQANGHYELVIKEKLPSEYQDKSCVPMPY